MKTKIVCVFASLACLAAIGAVQEVKHDGKLVGLSLFDGKVLANGNISGSAKYILENCPVDDGIKYETRAGENSLLVKWVFPKAVELRVQIDYGYGFPKGTKVRMLPCHNDDACAAVVDAPEGKVYFYTEFSTPYSRPSLFADGTIHPWSGNSGEIEGASPVGYSIECFYGVEGDDIQARTAFSRTSLEDAKRLLAAEQPLFLPVKRDVIWQYEEASWAGRAPMKGDMKAPSLKYIQRTMKALEESTAENPSTVRVLFYGQSIVWQFWSRLMMKDLKAKFPTVNFVWKNLAIGGLEADKLRDEFEHDVCGFYPDILFFHVYGSLPCYEDMVRMARERTSAEIVLWTSHVNDPKSDIDKLLAERDERSRFIIATAEKYRCHIIDLNLKWLRLLKEKGWQPSELLCDGIHLNGKGNMYYKDFIEEELLRIPGASGDAAANGTIEFIPWDGKGDFAFDGNRVVAVSDGTADADLDAEILLDGRPLAGMPELWAVTRPTALFAWFPGVHSFRFGKTVPVAEDWTFEIAPRRDGDPTNSVVHNFDIPGASMPPAFSKLVPRRFKVHGSVSGDDGEGITTEEFVSKSGRLVIPTRAWVSWGWWQNQIPGPGEKKSHWTVRPLFTDRLKATAAGTETLILQGCANGPHKLSIKLPKGAKSGIAGFKVWTPAKQ